MMRRFIVGLFVLCVATPVVAQTIVNPTGVQFDHPVAEQQTTDTYQVLFFAAGATVPISTYTAPKALVTCVVAACALSISNPVNALIATQAGRGTGFTVTMIAANALAGASGSSLPSTPFTLMGVPLAPTAITLVRQ